MKALALISGGLDSRLAAKLISGQGVDILALNFRIPFSRRGEEDSTASKKKQIENDLGVELRDVELAGDFLEIVSAPRHGYGSNLNPCIDCKILMLRKAGELMRQSGVSFLVTGEVLGQRPMSQHKQALAMIEREAGLAGLVLRPLSAKLLPETIPEKEGWVNRDKLMAFSGRTRRPQIQLAKELGIRDYPNPAGGCLLTDLDFSKKIKDLIDSGEFDLAGIELLKSGRYFRIREQAKLVVGRNAKENQRLSKLAKEGDYLFYPAEGLAGPTSLGRGNFDEESIKLSCRITGSYCDLNGSSEADIIYKRLPEEKEEILRVMPLVREEFQEFKR